MKSTLTGAFFGLILTAAGSGCLWTSAPDAGESVVRATDLSLFRASHTPLSTSSIKSISDLGAADALLIGIAPGRPLSSASGGLRAVFVLAGRGTIYLDDTSLPVEPDLLITFPPQKVVRFEAATPLRMLAFGPAPALDSE